MAATAMLRRCLETEFDLLEACNDKKEMSPEIVVLRGQAQEHIFDLDSLIAARGEIPMTYTGRWRHAAQRQVELSELLDRAIACYAEGARRHELSEEISTLLDANLRDLLIARRRMDAPRRARAAHRARARAWLHFALVGMFVCGVAGLVHARDRDPSFDDGVTTRAKIALLTTTGVNLTDVSVDTLGGVVTLHGVVATPAEKMRAEKRVKGVPGVVRVRNLVQVVRAEKQPAVAAKDGELKHQVEAQLKEERALVDTRIGVKSVNRGVVLLSGNASSITEHLDAIEAAREVEGVRGVESAVTTDDGAPVRRDRRDDLLTMAVKLRLLSSADLPALEVNVDTHHGVVTLFGFVKNDLMKAVATREAALVPGVERIDNRLQISDGAGSTPLVGATDEELRSRVTEALAAEPRFADLEVTVKAGHVELRVRVDGVWNRVRVATLARGVKGVRAVVVDAK